MGNVIDSFWSVSELRQETTTGRDQGSKAFLVLGWPSVNLGEVNGAASTCHSALWLGRAEWRNQGAVCGAAAGVGGPPPAI